MFPMQFFVFLETENVMHSSVRSAFFTKEDSLPRNPSSWYRAACFNLKTRTWHRHWRFDALRLNSYKLNQGNLYLNFVAKCLFVLVHMCLLESTLTYFLFQRWQSTVSPLCSLWVKIKLHDMCSTTSTITDSLARFSSVSSRGG